MIVRDGAGGGGYRKRRSLSERPRVLVSWGEAGNQENCGGCLYLCTELLGVVTVEACRHKQCVMSTMGCKLDFQHPVFLSPMLASPLSLCSCLEELRVPRQESAVGTFRSWAGGMDRFRQL